MRAGPGALGQDSGGTEGRPELSNTRRGQGHRQGVAFLLPDRLRARLPPPTARTPCIVPIWLRGAVPRGYPRSELLGKIYTRHCIYMPAIDRPLSEH